jgi:DNA repair protein RecO (recombination protein O)
MIEKTKGIVLHQIKYTDSGIIAHLYTKDFGRVSLLIKGMRKKKSGKHNIMFQPLSIIEIEMYHKPSREVQVLKEFSVTYSPYNIHTDIRKSSVAMFLGEVLSAILREESPHAELFDYIEQSIVYFDMSKENFANFHISFISGLSSYLGFEPSVPDSSEDVFFDMKEGSFVPVPPVHGFYADETISGILSKFFRSSYESANEIKLTGKQRNDVLDSLITFYSLHLPGLKKINSLEILREVFS